MISQLWDPPPTLGFFIQSFTSPENVECPRAQAEPVLVGFLEAVTTHLTKSTWGKMVCSGSQFECAVHHGRKAWWLEGVAAGV